MQYLYKCDNCKDEVTIVKDAKDSCREEKCRECGTIMQRVFRLFGIKTNDGVKYVNIVWTEPLNQLG